MSKLLILLAWCHIFAHASQVRDVAPDAIIKALHDARFAAGDTQGPGRIGQSFVRDVTPAGSTWDDVNVRAQLARAEVVRSDASRDFVAYYCDRGPFTSLLRPSSEVLRGLFQPRDSPNVVVVYLSRGEAAGVLQASMVLAGGCEFIAQDSRAGCSGNLVTLLFECIFSGKPTAAAGSGGADTAAAVVAAAARGACSSSVRKGGPLNLGCKGCIRLVASIVPDSNALAIVAVTPCTVTHNTADQAKAHLSLHPLVRAAIVSRQRRRGRRGRAARLACRRCLKFRRTRPRCSKSTRKTARAYSQAMSRTCPTRRTRSVSARFPMKTSVVSARAASTAPLTCHPRPQHPCRAPSRPQR